MISSRRPKSGDGAQLAAAPRNSLRALPAEAAPRARGRDPRRPGSGKSPRPGSSGGGSPAHGLHEMVPLPPDGGAKTPRPEPSARDALRAQLEARDRARAELLAATSPARGAAAAAASSSAPPEVVDEDASAALSPSRAALRAQVEARERARAELVAAAASMRAPPEIVDEEPLPEVAIEYTATEEPKVSRASLRRALDEEAASPKGASPTRRRDSSPRRGGGARRERSRGDGGRKPPEGRRRRKGSDGGEPTPRGERRTPRRERERPAPDGARSRPGTGDGIAAKNDRERAELWKELGDYANSIRAATDADGTPTVKFPANYDAVVDLMNRGDLADAPLGDQEWAKTTLRNGVSEACGAGEFARYRGILVGEDDEQRLLTGLATIERLDRELRKCQAKARAVRELGRLSVAAGAEADAETRPSTGRSTASSATALTDTVFLTDHRLEKRPRSKGSRFKDRGGGARPASRDAGETTDFLLDNAHRAASASLLTMDQEFRANSLVPDAEADDDAVLLALADYGGGGDLERLEEIDAQLRALGRHDALSAPLPGAVARAAAVLSGRARVAAAPGDDAGDYLARARAERAARTTALDLDTRLAAASGAPLVILDDDDDGDDAPPGAVRHAAVRALLTTLAADPPPPNPSRVATLLATMRPTIAVAAAARAERRRRRNDDDSDDDATPAAFEPETFGVVARVDGIEPPASARSERSEAPVNSARERLSRNGRNGATRPARGKGRKTTPRKVRAFADLEDGLLEAALRTEAALSKSEAALTRSGPGSPGGFFDEP